MTAAIVAALLSGCAVAPSPSPSSAATASAPPRVLFIGSEVTAGRAELVTAVDGGGVERSPLPALPEGALTLVSGGFLAFVSGPAERPSLWTAPPLSSDWTSVVIGPVGGRQDRLRQPCVGQGTAPEVALQTDGGAVFRIDGTTLRRLRSDSIALRPSGCLRFDAGHILVAFDRVAPAGIGFVLLALDGSAPTPLIGPGGEEPTRSRDRIASLAHGADGVFSIVVAAMPGADLVIPEPVIEIREPAGHAYLWPVLSNDGTRLAFMDRMDTARQLVLYDLAAQAPELLAAVDVTASDDAAPAWVADAP
jgi:hypothetical protein